jgi:hypothetical protein
VCEVAGRPRRARKPLEDNHASWVTEQGEQSQNQPELCRVRMGFRHLSKCQATLTHLTSLRGADLLGPENLIWRQAMIIGGHIIIYSKNAEADKAFIKDVLRFGYVDAHKGWLIFKLPPSEVAVHPSDENDIHEFYLMTDDLDAEMKALKKAGAGCEAVSQQNWGRSTRINLPGGGTLGLYQPRHERPQ